MRLKKVIFTLVIASLFNFQLMAEHPVDAHAKGETHHEETEYNLEKDKKETIAHHLADDHSFTITHGVSFPLPIILYTEGSFDIFMSSKFDGEHHTKVPYTINGRTYTLDHGHITEASGLHPLDLSITKNVFLTIIMSIFLIIAFSSLARSYKRNAIPTGFGRLLEPLVLFIRDEIARPNIGEKHYKRYMSYLLTVFFFIWFMNLAGMTPLGVNVTGNIAVTFSLAILTFVITNVTANKEYWGHIFWMPGVPVAMKFILAPIELLGVFVKPFVLMIRLYANIMAGHIVLMSLIGVMYVFANYFAKGAFFGLTLFLMFIELLVAFLQAYIFTMLTALYFGAAVAEHDDH